MLACTSKSKKKQKLNKQCPVNTNSALGSIAFSALTLLVGHQEDHPARKNIE